MLREKAKRKRAGHDWDDADAAGTAVAAAIARSFMAPSAVGVAPAAVAVVALVCVGRHLLLVRRG